MILNVAGGRWSVQSVDLAVIVPSIVLKSTKTAVNHATIDPKGKIWAARLVQNQSILTP